MGRTCVCGAETLEVDTKAMQFTTPDGTVVRQTGQLDQAELEQYVQELLA